METISSATMAAAATEWFINFMKTLKRILITSLFAALTLSGCTGEEDPSANLEINDSTIDQVDDAPLYSPKLCLARSEEVPDPAEILAGIDFSAEKFESRNLTNEVPAISGQVEGKSNDESALQYLAAGENGEILANPQVLSEPTTPLHSPVGLIKDGSFTPFEDSSLLDESDTRPLVAAPLIGQIQNGYAVWIEQIIDPNEARDSQDIEWRIMAADLSSPSPKAIEIESSLNLNNRALAPTLTPWLPPTTDGNTVWFEAAKYTDSGFEMKVLAVEIANPGVSSEVGEGILARTNHLNELIWAQPLTPIGGQEQEQYDLHLGAENLSLTINNGFSLAWLELDAANLILALQDTCSSRLILLNLDPQTKAVKQWLYAKADGVFISKREDLVLFSNATGNEDTPLYLWNLSTGEVNSAPAATGYAIGFIGQSNELLLPAFTPTDQGPRVIWEHTRIETANDN